MMPLTYGEYADADDVDGGRAQLSVRNGMQVARTS